MGWAARGDKAKHKTAGEGCTCHIPTPSKEIERGGDTHIEEFGNQKCQLQRSQVWQELFATSASEPLKFFMNMCWILFELLPMAVCKEYNVTGAFVNAYTHHV